MMTPAALKALIAAAAETGAITLADVADGDDFQTVAEWLEYAGGREIEDLAFAKGLATDTAGDIHELNHEAARRRARFAGLRGA